MVDDDANGGSDGARDTDAKKEVGRGGSSICTRQPSKVPGMNSSGESKA